MAPQPHRERWTCLHQASRPRQIVHWSSSLRKLLGERDKTPEHPQSGRNPRNRGSAGQHRQRMAARDLQG
jgi:hypothetical protein